MNTTFDTFVLPIIEFVEKQEATRPHHHNEKFTYSMFFRMLMYYFLSGEKSFKLFIKAKLNKGLIPDILGLQPVPYSTANEAFSRFSYKLFSDTFYHLLQTLPLKEIPELAIFGTLYCIDGSLFPVIHSMLWAEYTTNYKSLKLHLCFELNRMVVTEFLVTSANESERKCLLNMLKEAVTYVGDRGYMSFDLCYEIVKAKAHFVIRTKKGLIFSVILTLAPQVEPKFFKLFKDIKDELIKYDNDKHGEIYRLIQFAVGSEIFHILTNRLDLTTYQIIMIYAYRWQIELLFRFLKRTMNGIHLIKQDQCGVTIQFYAILIVAILQLHLKQSTADIDEETVNDVDKNGNGKVCSIEAKQLPNKSECSQPSKQTFFNTIGNRLNKYWKISLYWLSALRCLLAEPFDARAIMILNTS